MEKKLEEMDELELLRELVRRHDRQKIVGWIAAGGVAALALILLISALVLIPRVLSTLERANATLEQADTTLAETETLVRQGQEELKTMDDLITQTRESFEGIDGMIENVGKVVTGITDTLQEPLDKLNAIDFEKLSKAIEDLNSVISPLAKFFSRG